jgi:hypothetical protein
MRYWWGARAILARKEIDLLWDRAGFYEHENIEQAKGLEAWLNDKALPYLRAWCEDGEGFPFADEDREVSVGGDGFVLYANPRQSHGYLYMVAGPGGQMLPTPLFALRPINDSKTRCKRCDAYSGSKHKVGCPSSARVLARQAREGGPRDPDRRVRRMRLY